MQSTITNDLVPKLKALSPGGGSYLNEADPFDPDWKSAFYGVNYDRLASIKNKYDSAGVFYGRTTVGSDKWSLKDDGRLCRA